MTLRTRLRTDFWVGGLLLVLLFPLVRLLGHLLKRNHAIEGGRGCVVIKLVGAGSLFLAMPSMLEIRRTFPPGRFYLVGTPAVIKVAREFAWFDEYWAIDDSTPFALLRSTLAVLWRMARYTDHLIDLEVHSRLTTALTVLSTVRNRIGFVDEIVIWRRGFYTHMTYFNVHGPVYVFYDLLAKWFGIGNVSLSAFHQDFRERVVASRLPPDAMARIPYVTIGHGCSELGTERQLRPDEWKRLLRPVLLAGHEIVLLGGPADAPAGDAIIRELGQGQNLCGRLSISQSARMIAHSSGFYGIDSMLLHFSRALGVPTVAVFGPTDPETRLRPMGLNERIGYVRLPCSPCIHVNETPPCQGVRTCMARSLDSLVEAGIPARAAEKHPPVAPPVGWEVDHGSTRVHEVQVTCS